MIITLQLLNILCHKNLVFKRTEKLFNLVSWTMSDVAARVLCSTKSTFFEVSILRRGPYLTLPEPAGPLAPLLKKMVIVVSDNFCYALAI